VSWGCEVPEVSGATGFRHAVLFYRGLVDYQAAVAAFLQAGLARREPVLLAISEHAGLALPSGDGFVTIADIGELGRNPARVIPALRAFADSFGGRPVRIVTEFIWPGRSLAEMQEGLRTEALMQRALADVAATVICPYSVAGLPEFVLSEAACTHQWELRSGSIVPSPGYGGPEAMPAICLARLPPPPAGAERIEYLSDLRSLRAMIATAAQRAGLAAERVTDLTIAAGEVAANTLRHTAAGGTAMTWQVDGEMLCEISDSGHISDPLAGLRRPSLDEPGGQGLWLVNQVCDLVELRSSAAGTTVRLHMRVRNS